LYIHICVYFLSTCFTTNLFDVSKIICNQLVTFDQPVSGPRSLIVLSRSTQLLTSISSHPENAHPPAFINLFFDCIKQHSIDFFFSIGIFPCCMARSYKHKGLKAWYKWQSAKGVGELRRYSRPLRCKAFRFYPQSYHFGLQKNQLLLIQFNNINKILDTFFSFSL